MAYDRAEAAYTAAVYPTGPAPVPMTSCTSPLYVTGTDAYCLASISAISASIRVLIWSRIGRTDSTPLPAGSSRAQSR